MSKVIIIAEAGVNHNGSIIIAKKLVDVASSAGADYVKFQTFVPDLIVSETAQKADYQKTSSIVETQHDMLTKLTLNESEYLDLINHCKIKKIGFLSTAFDEVSALNLKKWGMNIYKIPSGEITNKPLIEFISSIASEIILSTGMSTLNEIENAIELIKNNSNQIPITILHCTSEYPAPFNEVNLNSMLTIKQKFNLPVGYSDHTTGIEIPIASAAMGAKVIEKHFTIDKKMSGPDHKASIDPTELKMMVSCIRNIEKALGKKEKKITNSEKKNIMVVRRSIHTRKLIRKGSIITKDDLIMLRPGDGISPMKIDLVIGSKANKDLIKNNKLKHEDFE